MIEKLFPQVEFPARYIGGEVGATRRDPSTAEVRVCLAFPDVYEVGMSHLGYQLLYAALNELPWCMAERVYAPWPDMEASLREAGLPLFALESRDGLAAFDLLGFTLQYELCSASILTMLDLAGLPWRAADRREDDPLIIAGGPCAANPEPWAPFFDALFIGEGEHAVIEMAEALRVAKQAGATRAERLTALAGVEGVYVPARRTPIFSEGRLKGFDLAAGEPLQVRQRVVADFENAPTPAMPLSANVRAVHDRLAVEVMRGCLRGCRFCQAGYLYRPARERSGERVAAIVRESLAATGQEEVSLLSLSTGDWSPVQTVLPHLMNDLAPRRIAVSLPSLRAESLTDEIVDAVKRVRRTGFTLAPEAATERLRRVINKPIDDKEVLASVRRVFEAGWELVKLYFMIGLPTETDEDVSAIADLVGRAFATARGVTRRARLNVTVSVFVPKPHTPFETFGRTPEETLQRRIEILYAARREMPRSVSISIHENDTSRLEAIIARGDRRLADVMEDAYRRGARLDGWREHFSWERWAEALAAADFDATALATREFAEGEPRPWDGVDIGVSREFLQAERERALAGEITTDCRTGACTDCGVCGNGVDNCFAPPHALPEPEPPRPESTEVFRYWVRFGKTGRARWIGHLDMTRAFERALRRVRLPLHFSQGFHPHPKMAFGPPLALGVASDEEWMDIVLASAIDTEEVRRQLDVALPDGFSVHAVAQVAEEATSVSAAVVGWDYTFDLGSVDEVNAAAELEKFLAATTRPVEVVKKKRLKTIDARTLVEQAMIEGGVLHLSQIHPPTGGLKTTVLVAQMLGVDTERILALALRKTRTRLAEGAGPSE
jgi:radical SAM family uncharacterized protein/radical SAM-linked protein